MKSFHSALLMSLGLLLPLEGSAVNDIAKLNRMRQPSTCDTLLKKGFSADSCREKMGDSDRMKEKWPSVAKIELEDTAKLCRSASNAQSLNNNRCEQAVEELKRLLKERKQAMLDRCEDRGEQYKACQACSTNLGASSCQEQNMAMNNHFKQRSQAGIARRKQLMEAAKNVENEMFQLSEDYGNNLSELKQDMMANKQTSPAAQEIGASSISDGLSKHGNASPAEIFRAVDEMRNKSEVTKSDLQQAENIQSQYARESLMRALEAKAARLEMEKENQQDSDGLKELDKNTSKVAKNTNNLNSVDPAASQTGITGSPEAESNTGSPSGLASLGGAAGAMGGAAGGGASGAGGGTQQLASDYGGTYDPNSANKTANNYMLNGVANPTAGAKDTAIQDVGATAGLGDEAGKVNSTSASRMALRDSLRAKLAEQLAQGKGGATGASQAAAGQAGLDAKLKEKAGANPDMLTGFSPAGFSVAGAGNFSMAQSETDAAVKEMMSEFEGALGGENGFGSGARHLASVADGRSAPEILSADSTDLFMRTRTFYERCQKRGCVTR